MTKDRQELAIFAFTVVTVVFLPISAISSIFGMNTSDCMQTQTFLYLWHDLRDGRVSRLRLAHILPRSATATGRKLTSHDAVRNMEYGQWLYWATAVPVTIGVVVIGLWWMGELGGLFRWAKGKTSRSGGGGSSALKESYSVQEVSLPLPPHPRFRPTLRTATAPLEALQLRSRRSQSYPRHLV